MTQTELEYKVAELQSRIASINGTRFAAFDYLAKGTGELARHTIQLGFNYHNLVEKSIEQLALLMVDGETAWTPLQKQAAEEVMRRLNKTMAAHALGEQNSDYTKNGQYISLGNGININSTDGTIQVFGLAHTKTVIQEGTYATVNSRPLTVAINEIRAQLPVSKFREFALDVGNILGARIQGETIELAPVGKI